MTDKPLLAYAVQEEDEGTGGIVFARSSAEARRRGSHTFGCGDFNWGKARRAKWADPYAPGPVPFKAQFENGWWVECFGCGQRIQEGAYDDDDNDVFFDIVEAKSGAVYCTPGCCERDRAETAAIKAAQDAEIERLKAALLAAFPEVTVADRHHAYVTRDKDGALVPQQAIVHFRFPGCSIGDATYRFDRPGDAPAVFVCGGDMAAWEAFATALQHEAPQP